MKARHHFVNNGEGDEEPLSGLDRVAEAVGEGVDDGLEASFVFGAEDGDGVAAEVGADPA